MSKRHPWKDRQLRKTNRNLERIEAKIRPGPQAYKNKAKAPLITDASEFTGPEGELNIT